MELSFKHQVGLVCVILLFPALCSCHEYVTNSRASYYNTPDGLGNPRGACGFGEYGRTMNNGSVAAVSGLWRNGAGCGACYQVWCKIPEYCNGKGVHVVATDYGAGDNTDFIMSKRGFYGLGRNAGASKELFKRGVVDIAFKRVPCRYTDSIKLHVQESSKNPGYFAVLILNADDITAVQMWLKRQQRWEPLRRVYGAVFDFANPPTGEILMRFQVGYKYWLLPKIAIPANWKPGATYDTKLHPY
ncbi:expansin-like B1 [Cajanus cajan]|uniref:Expansin-like B1 n=1 Tax=Cajanus cajan TaxID=3821 RepID=A0A151S9R4_CAJCA|nr:expansin-like B1 [Cajanus cajan]KYP51507.1 Expansin-like B1 [Cajanus cajan]